MDSLAGLLALEPIWKELQDTPVFSEFGSSFEVVSSIWQFLAHIDDPDFGSNAELLILVAYDQDKPVAIAPLMKVIKRRRLGPLKMDVSCIQFVSQIAERVFRFRNNIVTGDPSQRLMNAFVEWLYEHEKFDIISVAYIQENNANFLRSPSSKFFLSTGSYVEIDKFGDFEAYRKANYARRFKNNLRTARNRAKKEGLDVSLTLEAPTTAAFAEVLKLARSKFNAAEFLNEGYYAFVESICQKLPAEIVLASVNGQAVGYRIYIHFDDTKYLLDTFIDRTYRALELGALMSEKAIQESFRQKLMYHSEGLWGSFHVQKFATKEPRFFKHVYHGNSYKGMVSVWAVALRHKAFLASEL